MVIVLSRWKSINEWISWEIIKKWTKFRKNRKKSLERWEKIEKNILKYKNTRKNIHKVPNYGSKRSKSSEKMPIEMEFFPEMWFGWRKRMCWLAVNSMRSTINHIHLWLDFSERHFIVNVNSIKWKPKSTVLPLNISRFRVRTHSFCSFCNYFCAHCNHDLSILCVRVRLSNFHHPRNSSIKTREREKSVLKSICLAKSFFCLIRVWYQSICAHRLKWVRAHVHYKWCIHSSLRIRTHTQGKQATIRTQHKTRQCNNW